MQAGEENSEDFPREKDQKFKPMSKYQIAKKYMTAIAVRNEFKIHNYNIPKCDRFSAIEKRAAGESD